MIAAVSSAPQPAPRGVIRLSGAAAFEVAAEAFTPPPPRPIRRGAYAGDIVLDHAGTPLPAELWCFPAPRSYTGENVVECHTIGAPLLLRRVLDRFVAAGARLAAPGEFTRRALLNGKMDLTRAEAVPALIRARDAAELARARALLEGGLARSVAALMDRLVALLASIELRLDFSDQDVALGDDDALAARASELGHDLGSLRASDGFVARRLLPRVVLRGPSNAGKSSLVNALAGRDVVLVADQRGTTRDPVAVEWRLRDARAVLVDTAGDDIAAAGVDALAHAARERTLLEADVVVEVREAAHGVWPAAAPAVVRVASKSDVAGAAWVPPAGVMRTSAVTGEGIEALAAALESALLAASARRPGPILVTARHAEHFGCARDAVVRAADALQAGAPLELAASDLHGALRHLRAVVGAEDGDPVLDRIFREFCIGK